MTVRKSGVFALVFVAAFALQSGCAAKEMRLGDRGLSSPDRREYISQNGYRLSKEVQAAFVEGRVVEGMTRDLVLQLFGTPDRTSEGGLLWEYVDLRGRDVVSLRFKDDRIVQVDGDALGRLKKGK